MSICKQYLRIRAETEWINKKCQMKSLNAKCQMKPMHTLKIGANTEQYCKNCSIGSI